MEDLTRTERQALTLYSEVLEMDRENTKAYYSMLGILLASSEERQALDLVTKLSQQRKETPDSSELCSVFPAVASETMKLFLTECLPRVRIRRRFLVS